MVTKNPFERTSGPSKPKKPKLRVNPRAAMMLSTSTQGVDVIGNNQAKNDYTQRIKPQEGFLREKEIEAKDVTKSIAPQDRVKKQETGPVANRRAAGLLNTSSGFEIMDNNLSKDGYVKRVREAQDLPKADKARVVRKEKLTGENYIKAYRQHQALDLVEDKKKAKEKEKSVTIAEERKKVENFVGRARKLQSEIALLERQMGQDAQNDSRLRGSIQQLTDELKRIPSVYW